MLEKPSDAERDTLAYGIESKPLACGSCSKLTLWQTDGIKDVPAAVYILMALEAARQLRSSAEADDGLSLQLTNIVFYERLSLKLFATPDASLEVQLTSRNLDDTHNYQFDIFFLTPRRRWWRGCLRGCTACWWLDLGFEAALRGGGVGREVQWDWGGHTTTTAGIAYFSLAALSSIAIALLFLSLAMARKPRWTSVQDVDLLTQPSK